MVALFFVRRWNLTIGVLIGDVAYNICISPLIPAIFCLGFWLRVSINLQVAADCGGGLRQETSKKFFTNLKSI
jgi:hypothetical protein